VERAQETLVLDASAATKWFVEEEESSKALVLRDAHRDGRIVLTAPDLLVYEVANALNYNPKITNEQLTRAIRGLVDLDLDLLAPSAEYMAQTARLARKLSISTYDASYTALSELLGTSLVTADKKLYEKIRRTIRVLLVRDLGLKWSLPR